jgi:hypothetical protein
MAEPKSDPLLTALEVQDPLQQRFTTPTAQLGLAGLGPSTVDTAVTGDTDFARTRAVEQAGLRAPPANLPGFGAATSPYVTPDISALPTAPRPTAAPRTNIAYSPSTKKFFVNNVLVDADNALAIAEGAKSIGAPAQPAPASVATDWQPVSPQEYLGTVEQLKQRRGVLGNLRVGLQTAGEGIVGGVGRLVEFAGAPETGRAIAGFAERNIGLSKEDQTRSELIKQSNSYFANIVDAAIQGIPFVIGAGAGGLGGAALAARALGAGARTIGGISGAAAVSFPTAVQGLYESAVQNNFDVNAPEVRTQILGGALASSMLDALVPGGVASAALRQRVRDVATGVVQGQLSGLARARAVGAAAAGASLTEAATEAVQTLIEQVTFDREFRKQLSAGDFKAMVPYIVEKYGQDVAIAAGAGALLGGGIGGAGKFVETSPRDLLTTAVPSEEPPAAPAEPTAPAEPQALPAPAPTLALPAPTPGVETTPTVPTAAPVEPAAPEVQAPLPYDERFVNNVTAKLTQANKTLPKAQKAILTELAARRKDLDVTTLSEEDRAALADPKASGLNEAGLSALLARVRDAQQIQTRAEVIELLSRGVEPGRMNMLSRAGVRKELDKLRTPPAAPVTRAEDVIAQPPPAPVLALPSPTGPGGVLTPPPPTDLPPAVTAATQAEPILPPAAPAPVAPAPVAPILPPTESAAPTPAAPTPAAPTPAAPTPAAPAPAKPAPAAPAPAKPALPDFPPNKNVIQNRVRAAKQDVVDKVRALPDADKAELFGKINEVTLGNRVRSASGFDALSKLKQEIDEAVGKPVFGVAPKAERLKRGKKAAAESKPAAEAAPTPGEPRAPQVRKEPEGRQPERAPADGGRKAPKAGRRDRTQQGREEPEVEQAQGVAAPRIATSSIGSVDQETVNYVSALTNATDMRDTRVVVVNSKDVDQLVALGVPRTTVNAWKRNYFGPTSTMRMGVTEFGANPSAPDTRYFFITPEAARLRTSDSATTRAAYIELLAHEVGHIVQRDAFVRASEQTKAAIIKAHDQHYARTEGMVSAGALARETLPRAFAETELRGYIEVGIDPDKANLPPKQVAYLRSFNEWFANETARWATTQRQPLNLVERFFKSVAGVLRRLHGSYIDQTDAAGVPSKAMKDFLDSLAANSASNTVTIIPAQPTPPTPPGGGIEPIRALTETKESINNYIDQNVPEQLRASSRSMATNLYDLYKRGLYGLSFGRDLVDSMSKMLPAARAYFNSMAKVSADSNRLWQQANAVMADAMTVKGEARTDLNNFLAESTRKQKWGYQPTWRPRESVGVDPAMKKLYDKLTPEAKQIADRVFQHSYNSRQEMRTAIRGLIEGELTSTEFNALPTDLKNQRRAAVARRLKSFDTLVPELQGPYAPLSRFGNYVAVAKSARYIEAEKVYDAAPTELNREALDELRSSDKDYAVSFAPSLGAAQKLADYFKRERGFDFTDHYARMEFGTRELEKASWAGIQRLKSQLDTELRDADVGDKAMLERLNEFVQDMYIATLSEASARRHNLKREGIAGFDPDMMHSFAVKSRSEANFIAAAKSSAESSDALAELRRQAKLDTNDIAEYNSTQPQDQQVTGSRADRTRAAKELLQRHVMGVTYQDTPIQDRMMTVNFLWMLALKPSYYIVNALQSYVLSLPVMAARFGYGKSAKALTDAYGDIIKGIGSDGGQSLLKFWRGQLDLTTVKRDGKNVFTPDEIAMLEYQRDSGLIDIGLAYDIGYWEAHSGSNVASRAFQTTVQKLTTVNRQVELLNRISSGLAAHRLYKSAPIKGKSSNDYVSEILSQTQGDYSGINAPRYFSSFQGSKVVFQFRKFQLMQATLLARNLQQAFKGATPEERVLARKTLGFVLGQTSVLTGALGLPTVAAAVYVYGLAFGDEEEPINAERILRRAIGNDNIADFILKGVPAGFGVDLSGQLGMSTAFSILPYTDVDLSTREDFAETVLGLGGPTTGLAYSLIDAMGFIKRGDTYKGIEAVLPSGLKHGLKAYRETYAAGITRRNGDQVISPEEFNFFQSFAQAVGFNTTKMQEIRRTRQDIFEYEKYFRERTTQIRKDYVEARKSNDFTAMEQAKQNWQNLQAAKLRVNMKPSPLGNLYLAPTQQVKREREFQELVRKQRELQ